MQEEAVVAADVVAHLAGGLEERKRLDVADGAADLGDDDVHVWACHRPHALLDLIGDMRDHLHGVSEIVPAPLLGDHRRVHLAGGHVGLLGEVDVEETLIVPDVEVGLGSVVGDEHLAVLERVHGPGIDVEVGVELLHRDPEATRLEQAPQRRGRQALPERRRDAAGDEQMLGRRRGCQQSHSRGFGAAGANASTGFQSINTSRRPRRPRGPTRRPRVSRATRIGPGGA